MPLGYWIAAGGCLGGEWANQAEVSVGRLAASSAGRSSSGRIQTDPVRDIEASRQPLAPVQAA
jgi:hypothetical protein